MADWDPALYRRFESERTRPAIDLLARVPLTEARDVVDLGCGPGNSTELLAARYPQARIVGIDASEAMLASARERLPRLRFERADIADWRPARPPTLIFANAVLQWLPGHAVLLPRLFDSLAPGGVLALQMPDNLDQPRHRAGPHSYPDQIGGASGSTRRDPLGGTHTLSPPAARRPAHPARRCRPAPHRRT